MVGDDTRDLVAEVAATIEGLGTRVGEYPRHLLEVLALFDRCRGLFGAVRLLTEQRFGQEALILGRALFTESLMLMELASADETRRVELVVGWSLGSLDDFEGVLREAQSRGDDCSDELAKIGEMRSSLEAYAHWKGAGTRRWRVDEKQLADVHRHGDGYLDFRMAHHFVHGSAFAADQRHTHVGQFALIGAGAGDPDWAEAAVLFAAQSMLYAVRGVCGTLGWEEPEGVSLLLERLDRMADERSNS